MEFAALLNTCDTRLPWPFATRYGKLMAADSGRGTPNPHLACASTVRRRPAFRNSPSIHL
jgi:hypothetical protein